MADPMEDMESQHLISEKKKNYLDKMKGFLGILMWIFANVLSSASCQLLDRKIPDFELNAVRMSVGVVAFSLAMVYTKKSPMLKRDEILPMLLFGTVTCANTLFLYTSVTFIALSVASTISMTTVVISGFIIFTFFNNDVVTLKKGFAAVFCVGGVLLVIQPEFLFKEKNTPNKIVITVDGNSSANTVNGYGSANSSHVLQNGTQEVNGNNMYTVLGYMLSIGYGIMNTSRTSVAKKYPFLKEKIIQSPFWVSVISVIFSVIPMAIFETPVLPENWRIALIIMVHCSTYIFGLPGVIVAATYLSGHTVNVLACTSVIFQLIAQYTVLSDIHPGHRNWIEVVGVFLVLIGSAMGSLLELLTTKKEKSIV